jgi:hypothetical protein
MIEFGWDASAGGILDGRKSASNDHRESKGTHSGWHWRLARQCECRLGPGSPTSKFTRKVTEASTLTLVVQFSVDVERAKALADKPPVPPERFVLFSSDL